MENMKEKTLASTTGKVACFSHFCANVVLQGKDGRVFGKRSEFGFETTKKNKKKRSETGGMKRIVQVCLSLLVEYVRLVAYIKKFELHNVCM